MGKFVEHVFGGGGPEHIVHGLTNATFVLQPQVRCVVRVVRLSRDMVQRFNVIDLKVRKSSQFVQRRLREIDKQLAAMRRKEVPYKALDLMPVFSEPAEVNDAVTLVVRNCGFQPFPFVGTLGLEVL